MMAFWDGMKVAFILTFLFGPVFFTLIQTGVEQGFRAGVAFASGVWTSDAIYMALVFSGLAYLGDDFYNSKAIIVLGLLGGAFLIGLGLFAAFARPTMRMRPRKVPIRSSSYGGLWLKGLLMNLLNPFAIFFWIGVLSTVFVRENPPEGGLWPFLGGFMILITITDSFKAAMSRRIRRWLGPRQLLWFRRISGILLTSFGLVLLVRTIYLLYS